jgi:hypothetical protein
MQDDRVRRETIIQALVGTIEPLQYVHAMWEGGAVAFDRLDRWSDVDICVDADDERVEDVFPAAESALASVAPIELKYDVPAASTHGYVQSFYRLEGTPKFMLVDFAVFAHSEPAKLLEPEIHGKARFYFNKQDAVTIPALDRRAFLDRLKARLGRVSLRFEMFSCFVEKEINRGNFIEAVDAYYRIVLGSLLEGLRMRHCPVHFDFGTRYVHYELPPGVLQELVDLYSVADQADLARKAGRATEWFRETVAEIDPDLLERLLGR